MPTHHQLVLMQEEGLVLSFLQGFSPHTSMSPEGMHPSELGEVADHLQTHWL